MGLKKAVQTKYGMTAENAYHRIATVRGNSAGKISYVLETYYDYDSYANGGAPLNKELRDIPESIKTKLGLLRELYDLLKQDEIYADAEDVLETDIFSAYQAQHFANGYILQGTLADGHSVVSAGLSSAEFSGKCIIENKIVVGQFSAVNATNITLDGYGTITGGYLQDGYVDGFVVQEIL